MARQKCLATDHEALTLPSVLHCAAQLNHLADQLSLALMVASNYQADLAFSAAPE